MSIARAARGRRGEMKYQTGGACQAMQGVQLGEIAAHHFHAELARDRGIGGGSHQYDDAVFVRQPRGEAPADVAKADNQDFLRTYHH